MRFRFDKRRSARLRANPKRGIGFDEDVREQYRAIAWMKHRLYSVIFETREDDEGEYYHLVTLWRAIKQERKLYEDHP